MKLLRLVKWYSLWAALAWAISTAALHADPYPSGPPTGIRMLEKRIKLYDFYRELLRTGRQVGPRDYLGKVLVIHFWATWCPPCYAELSAIPSLQVPGLAWLTVNSGEDRTTVARYMDDYSYDFPVILDPENSLMRKYGVQDLPSTIFVDKNGYVVALAAGSVNWREPLVREMLENWIAE